MSPEAQMITRYHGCKEVAANTVGVRLYLTPSLASLWLGHSFVYVDRVVVDHVVIACPTPVDDVPVREQVERLRFD